MDIYSYITNEESSFRTDEVAIGDNWQWNFRKHIQMIFHFKNSKFFTGANNYLRSFKQIMQPIINLSYWAQDIEVKDVVFFIESEKGKILSFLIKKYHDEVYAKEKNLDTLIDEIGESDIDYGGALVQKKENGAEVLALESIAFCDQTDILGGPIGFRMNFTSDKLRTMSVKGWGDKANGATTTIEEVIKAATSEKESPVSKGVKNKTTGKNIEVFVVKGSLPTHFLDDKGDMENYFNQIHIVAFYQTDEGETAGKILYRKKWDEKTMKFHTSKKVYGRALGVNTGEELIHPQIWSNFLEIHKMTLLEGAAKNIPYTDDPNFATRNNIDDIENNEIMEIAENKTIGQVPTFNANAIALFERALNEKFEQGQTIGSAFDPLLGKQPPSGSTFRGQERAVFQGRGIHERRRGQRAKFIEELYRGWFIPDMVRGILKGKEFLATLDFSELEWISDKLAENLADKQRLEEVLAGQFPTDRDLLIQKFKGKSLKIGNKRLLEILKDEFKEVEIKIGISISGKQKDLLQATDKFTNIFIAILSNPQGFRQVMQMPGMSQIFSEVLEFSGLSIASFYELINGALPGSIPAESAAPPALPAREPQIV